MLLLFLSLAVTIFVIYEIMAVTHPYPLDYGEAPLVDQAMRLAAGQNIYRADVSTPPYTISNYPPGYVLSLALFVKLFGPNFWAGRLISLLSSLAAGSCLALIVYEFSREKLAAWAAALLFWAIPYVVHWSPLLRIDLLALALSLAALTVLVRRPEGRRSLVVGAALLTAAIYTRQSYALAAPLAAFVWLWTQGGWRRAFTLAALVAGASLLLFLGLNLATGGGFYFNVVTANVNAFDMGRLGWNLSRIRDALPLLLLIGAASLFLTPGRTRSWSLAVPYLVGAFLSTLTIGKVGSNVNYFLELCAALSLAAGLAIAWSREHPWARSVLLVLLALQTGLLMQTTFDEYVGPLRERRQSLKLLRDLEWKVAHAAGPVLADEYMGILTLQGWPLYIQPFEMTQLSDAGLWDQTPFVESAVCHQSRLLSGQFPCRYARLPSAPVVRRSAAGGERCLCWRALAFAHRRSPGREMGWQHPGLFGTGQCRRNPCLRCGGWPADALAGVGRGGGDPARRSPAPRPAGVVLLHRHGRPRWDDVLHRRRFSAGQYGRARAGWNAAWLSRYVEWNPCATNLAAPALCRRRRGGGGGFPGRAAAGDLGAGSVSGPRAQGGRDLYRIAAAALRGTRSLTGLLYLCIISVFRGNFYHRDTEDTEKMEKI
jgi:hypothetical protein